MEEEQEEEEEDLCVGWERSRAAAAVHLGVFFANYLFVCRDPSGSRVTLPTRARFFRARFLVALPPFRSLAPCCCMSQDWAEYRKFTLPHKVLV